MSGQTYFERDEAKIARVEAAPVAAVQSRVRGAPSAPKT